MVISDPIVDTVIEKFNERSKIGLKKYGTTLFFNNVDDFFKHAQEEAMDFILYIEKLKSQSNNLLKLGEIIRNTPNDQDLGELIRKEFNNGGISIK